MTEQKRNSNIVNKKRTKAGRRKYPTEHKPLEKQELKLKVFKIGVAAAILAYVIVLLVMTGGSSKPFEKIKEGTAAAIDTDVLTEAPAQGLRRYYGLNAADYKGVMLYVSKSSMSAEEVLLIEVKSNKQIESVQNAINTRSESRRKDFEGYAPDEVELIDGSVLSVRGDFIFFTISSKASEYKSAFTKSL